MDLEKFIRDRPFLYHLTSQENAESIIAAQKLLSANAIIDISNNASYCIHKRTRRTDHVQLVFNDQVYHLRDQRPISEKALAKCLTDNWTVGDFLFHLNDRVFMWPTLERLWRHFNRYERESPIIFRFSTKEVIELNPHVKFCRLNSGATRANSYLGGKPPERGAATFLPAELFQQSVREVAEVTFENHCFISGAVWTSHRPDGPFSPIA